MDGRRMERREVFVQGKSFAAAAIFFFDGEKSGEKRERGGCHRDLFASRLLQ
jgi:hypothetical protein